MDIEPGQDGTEGGHDGGVEVATVLGVLSARLMFDVVTHPQESLTRIGVTCVRTYRHTCTCVCVCVCVCVHLCECVYCCILSVYNNRSL